METARRTPKIGTIIRHPLTEDILLFFGVLASRLPFCGRDFGVEPDAYRIVLAARHFAATGELICIRSPCHPVPVLTYGAVCPISCTVFNTVTALLSAMAAVAFSRALKSLGVKSGALAAAAVALSPLVYINSASAMDYIWALSFAALSVFGAVAERPLLSGIALGIAAGCRLEYGVIALPLLLYLTVTTARERRLAAMFRWILGMGATTVAVFLPVLEKYDIGFIFGRFKTAATEKEMKELRFLIKIIDQAVFQPFGGIGAAILLILLVFVVAQLALSKDARGRFRALSPKKLGWLLMCLTATALFLVGYLRAPYKAGYFLPAVPFVIGFFAVVLNETRPGRIAAVAGFSGMLLSPFLIYISLGTAPGTFQHRWYLTDDDRLPLYLGTTGPVFQKQQERGREQHRFYATMEDIIALSRQSNRETVIVAGAMTPRLKIEWAPQIGDHVRLVELIKRQSDLDAMRRSRTVIYYLPSVDAYNKYSYNIDLKRYGRPLTPR